MLKKIITSILYFTQFMAQKISAVEDLFCYPQQVHINQGKKSSQMIISWLSDLDENYCPSVVKIDGKIFKGETVSYFIKNQTEFNNYQSSYIHHVLTNDLISGQSYTYDILNSEFNSIHNSKFETIGNSYPLSFGVIGDLGQTSYSVDTIKHLNADKQIKMILHAGDLSYADCQQKLWDSYGYLVEPLANHIPWMVCVGNHEIEYYDDNTQLYLAFESRYRMQFDEKAVFGPITIPSAVNPSTSKPYCTPSIFQSGYDYGNSFYSFNSGPAHIIYLNPYAETAIGSTQYNWLSNDLIEINKLSNKKLYPWLIVVMHCPWYNSNYKHYADEQTVLMRESMEELLFKYKVNLVISGHVHAYERTYPVYKNQTMKYAPTYISIGDGGNLEGLDNKYYSKPDWSAFRNGTQYGHGKLTLLDEKKMIWRWYKNDDKQLIFRDEVIINNYE
jgi:Icc-related predicted phosphoesterase